MKAIFQLLRPLNCVMVAAAVAIGALVASGLEGVDDNYRAVGLACIVAFLFTGAGNSLNDYYDRETDRINHPKRPIPSGKIKSNSALFLAIILFIVSLFMALFINIIAFIIVIANLAVMLSYEIFSKAKGAQGNITISWLTATTFLFGGAAVWAVERTFILAVLAFLATLGREIAKDIEDIKGDKDRYTLPMKMGIKNAGIAASSSIALGVLISPMPLLTGVFSSEGSRYYIPAIVVADAIFIYCIFLLLRGNTSASTPIKGAMLIALLAFLAGGILPV
ncbi:MAG: UbiA family prenyltransferase [Thermoplasmata archaeon]|nr:MAG: UbiA family prenyltransferase [Thermoplasmata archaeon]